MSPATAHAGCIDAVDEGRLRESFRGDLGDRDHHLVIALDDAGVLVGRRRRVADGDYHSHARPEWQRGVGGKGG